MVEIPHRKIVYQDKVIFANRSVHVFVLRMEAERSVAYVITAPKGRPNLAEIVCFDHGNDERELKQRTIQLFNAACTGSPDGDPHDPINGAIVEHVEMHKNFSVYAAHLESVKFDDVMLDKIIQEQAVDDEGTIKVRHP